jgi:beta-1,4-mannosyl-glycoprotein beta-1,4-N-acetylglucosaminyltransferase
MVAIIDVFPYNGEPIAELRLEYLATSSVTEFVIIESRFTHSGLPKPELYIEKYRDSVFRPYLNKIHFITIDEFPPEHNNDSWSRERYQRDVAMDYITSKYDEYILMVCDVDEIPAKKVVNELSSRYFSFQYPTHFEMQFFYYNFKWIKKFSWFHAFCINDIGVRRSQNTTLSDMRTGPSMLYIPTAGWHASYFMNKSILANKLISFAHTECNTTAVNNTHNIETCIAEGRDIIGRGEAEDLLPYDVSLLPKQFKDFNDRLVFLQRYS